MAVACMKVSPLPAQFNTISPYQGSGTGRENAEATLI